MRSLFSDPKPAGSRLPGRCPLRGARAMGAPRPGGVCPAGRCVLPAGGPQPPGELPPSRGAGAGAGPAPEPPAPAPAPARGAAAAAAPRVPRGGETCSRSPCVPSTSDAGSGPAVAHSRTKGLGRGQEMQRISCLLTGFVLILGVTSTEHLARSGRRVCSTVTQSQTVSYLESHVQPVYQPYLTTCQGHRVCSTYRTIYKVAHRQAFKKYSQPMYTCCPGWRRASGHAASCNTAVCRAPCQNGGRCSFPDRCTCPPGWTGRACQTDMDECSGQGHGCGQRCVNTPGSYRCACHEGHRLSADGKSCRALQPASRTEVSAPPALNRSGGASGEVKEEMKALRSRMDVLEQKLQLVLAPFHHFVPAGLDDVSPDPITVLSHSLQQLDRIDSLSEQISFLEERLETCSCKNEL